MNLGPDVLLIGAVAAVGVLHTIVPDHWVPITLIARQRGWTQAETARAALVAGLGHVVSTLVIALLVWLVGIAVAARFGQLVDAAASLALIGFGGWIAVSAWRELRGRVDVVVHGHDHGHNHGHAHFHAHSHARAGLVEHDHEHGQGHRHDAEWAPHDDPLYAPLRGETAVLTRHIHIHRHGPGPAHVHWHDHTPETTHPVSTRDVAPPPLHAHRHRTSARTALLLILGSSPMVEGIPAFFAAAKYGAPLIIAMSLVFALSTIVTYMLLCVFSTAGLQRIRLGALERYGEVLSGAVIMVVGLVFWIWPVM